MKMTLADNALTQAISTTRQSMAAGMAWGLIDFAASRGADRAVLLATADLSNSESAGPNARIPLATYAALLREATRQCGDPALAVRFAESTHFADLSIVGLIGYASATMRDALDQLNRFGRLAADIAIDGPNRFVLTHEPDGLWLTDHRIDNPPFAELTESTFVRMVAGTRQFGDTPFVSMVELLHDDRGIRAELERALGAPVRFGAGRNALRVSLQWQSFRVALYPRYAFGVFCAHAERLMAELDAALSVAGQIERTILPMLHTGNASVVAVARQLGLSEQALYRALRAEGTTFEHVRARLRHRFAQGYLEKGDTTLKEIAYLLGYSDVSAFSRAFKRHEGLSPGKYRRARNNDEVRTAAGRI
jgi:AraC-like DNA-binding protein